MAAPTTSAAEVGGATTSNRKRGRWAPQPDGEATKKTHVMRQLWQLYVDAVEPLERKAGFHHFYASPVTMAEFEARPQVLLLGQYSTGKTSMVKWLTGVESASFNVRPQPSTDKFMAVVHGAEEMLINGNAAACLPHLPYQGLEIFGASFLGSFQALALPADMLQEITFIDTPGVLSGKKQVIGRDYSFAHVAAWMAERADMVLLLFDAHKLDISDEFQEVMEVLRPHANKVRCVLNKADEIDANNLVRVYGALLWNVAKVLPTPEVARVFISSFWDKEYAHKEHTELLDEDKDAILQELYSLPRNALLGKINTFVVRVRRLKAHLCVMTYIQSQVPFLICFFGMEDRLRKWIDENLEELLEGAQKLHDVSTGDMPNIETFREKLKDFADVLRMPAYLKKDIEVLDKLVSSDVPGLMTEVGGVSPTPTSTSSPSQHKPKAKVTPRRRSWWAWLYIPFVIPLGLALLVHRMILNDEVVPPMLAALFLGSCDSVHCGAGYVVKSSVPRYCRGTHCVQTECCDPAGVCESGLCGSHQVLKSSRQVHCKNTSCTQDECCENEPKIPGSASWWSCNHKGMHPCDIGPGCCCNTGSQYDASAKACVDVETIHARRAM